MFRFNPGKDEVIFPPDHPYAQVQGAKEVTALLKNNENTIADKPIKR